MSDHSAPLTDPVHIRHADRELLSLALMDARNQTLRCLSALEQAHEGRPLAKLLLWHTGHVGWFQEYWLARHLQRHRGADADRSLPRLASIEPRADTWFSEAGPQWDVLLGDLGPSAMAVRDYLASTLDLTLELLEGSSDQDDSLYYFRLALLHEDRHAEALLAWAQSAELSSVMLDELVHGPRPQVPGQAWRAEAITWRQGLESDGLVLDSEAGSVATRVPAFEIDARPVNWAQYSEFIADGGYDQRDCWSLRGWAWLQGEGRRSPRYVEHVGNGVMVQRFGRPVRLSMLQPVMHLNLHEAEAWCRWAGRRLPTEVEWEVAASLGGGRGFEWGQVREWTASAFRLFPGVAPAPWRQAPPSIEACAVRGASFLSAPRLHHIKARDGLDPLEDGAFVGFRSCAL